MAAFEDSDYDVVGVSWTTSPAEVLLPGMQHISHEQDKIRQNI